MSLILVRRACLASRMSIIRLSSTSAASSQSDDYFTKNERLNRPLSPYTIYKPQMTTVLSISHRMTGLALAVLLYGGGISALASQQTNFAQVIQSIQSSVSPSILLTLKVLAGTSLAYHTFNGLRHLTWDFGYGFTLKQLYTSGYVVLGLTLMAAVAFALANN